MNFCNYFIRSASLCVVSLITPSSPSALGRVTSFQAARGTLFVLISEPLRSPYLLYLSTSLMIVAGNLSIHMKNVGNDHKTVATLSSFSSFPDCVKNCEHPNSLLSIF